MLIKRFVFIKFLAFPAHPFDKWFRFHCIQFRIFDFFGAKIQISEYLTKKFLMLMKEIMKEKLKEFWFFLHYPKRLNHNSKEMFSIEKMIAESEEVEFFIQRGKNFGFQRNIFLSSHLKNCQNFKGAMSYITCPIITAFSNPILLKAKSFRPKSLSDAPR